MKVIFYITLGTIAIFLIILIIGLFLPKTRVLTKQTIYDASVEKVYNTVTNNKDWKYRTSLDDLKIIKTNGDFEVWKEYSGRSIIQFKTKEKTPFRYYSFEMDSKLFKGFWYAEFESITNGKTSFTATESIEYKNIFTRIFGYVFIDLDKYMETYQNELRNKLKQ